MELGLTMMPDAEVEKKIIVQGLPDTVTESQFYYFMVHHGVCTYSIRKVILSRRAVPNHEEPVNSQHVIGLQQQPNTSENTRECSTIVEVLFINVQAVSRAMYLLSHLTFGGCPFIVRHASATRAIPKREGIGANGYHTLSAPSTNTDSSGIKHATNPVLPAVGAEHKADVTHTYASAKHEPLHLMDQAGKRIQDGEVLTEFRPPSFANAATLPGGCVSPVFPRAKILTTDSSRDLSGDVNDYEGGTDEKKIIKSENNARALNARLNETLGGNGKAWGGYVQPVYIEPTSSCDSPPGLGWELHVFTKVRPIDDGPKGGIFYLRLRRFFILGRDRSKAHIPLDNPACSPQHAVLQYLATPATACLSLPYILDLNSTCGTYVNGQKLPAQEYKLLHHLDVLQFAPCPRRYVLLHKDEVSSEMKKGKSLLGQNGGPT